MGQTNMKVDGGVGLSPPVQHGTDTPSMLLARRADKRDIAQGAQTSAPQNRNRLKHHRDPGKVVRHAPAAEPDHSTASTSHFTSDTIE